MCKFSSCTRGCSGSSATVRAGTELLSRPKSPATLRTHTVPALHSLNKQTPAHARGPYRTRAATFSKSPLPRFEMVTGAPPAPLPQRHAACHRLTCGVSWASASAAVASHAVAGLVAWQAVYSNAVGTMPCFAGHACAHAPQERHSSCESMDVESCACQTRASRQRQR